MIINLCPITELMIMMTTTTTMMMTIIIIIIIIIMLVIHSEMMDLLNPTYNSSDRVLFLPKPPPIKRDTEKRENIHFTSWIRTHNLRVKRHDTMSITPGNQYIDITIIIIIIISSSSSSSSSSKMFIFYDYLSSLTGCRNS